MSEQKLISRVEISFRTSYVLIVWNLNVKLFFIPIEDVFHGYKFLVFTPQKN